MIHEYDDLLDRGLFITRKLLNQGFIMVHDFLDRGLLITRKLPKPSVPNGS